MFVCFALKGSLICAKNIKTNRRFESLNHLITRVSRHFSNTLCSDINYNHKTFCETNFRINRIEKLENVNGIIHVPKSLPFLFSLTLTFYMKESCRIQNFKLI